VVGVLNFLIGKTEQLLAATLRSRRTPASTAPKPPAGRATLVILCWKRHANVRQIVGAYAEYARIGEIIVWNNNAARPFLFAHPKVRCINSDEFGLNTRWAALLLARHACVIVADDDLLCGEETINHFIDAHENDPNRTYALHGRQPTAGNEYALEVDRVSTPTEVDIHLTRLACTDRRFGPKYFELLPAIGIEIDPATGGGEDIAFSYIVRHLTGKRPMILPGRYTDLVGPQAITHRNASQWSNRTAIMRRCQTWFESAGRKSTTTDGGRAS
jgi:hypothetical protein